MKTLKLILIFYLTVASVYFLTDRLFADGWTKSINYRKVFIASAVITILSICISSLYNWFNNTSNKNKSHKVVFIALGCLFLIPNFYFSFTKWTYNREYGNIEHNNSYFNSGSLEDSRRKKSLAELSSKFKDKNSFRVTWYSDETKDTLIDNTVETIYYTKLEYKKREFKYKALVSDFRNAMKLLYYDKQLTDFEKSQKDTLNNILRKTKKVLKDSFGEKINLIDN
jgi:hypothetical protein